MILVTRQHHLLICQNCITMKELVKQVATMVLKLLHSKSHQSTIAIQLATIWQASLDILSTTTREHARCHALTFNIHQARKFTVIFNAIISQASLILHLQPSSITMKEFVLMLVLHLVFNTSQVMSIIVMTSATSSQTTSTAVTQQFSSTEKDSALMSVLQHSSLSRTGTRSIVTQSARQSTTSSPFHTQSTTKHWFVKLSATRAHPSFRTKHAWLHVTLPLHSTRASSALLSATVLLRQTSQAFAFPSVPIQLPTKREFIALSSIQGSIKPNQKAPLQFQQLSSFQESSLDQLSGLLSNQLRTLKSKLLSMFSRQLLIK